MPFCQSKRVHSHPLLLLSLSGLVVLPLTPAAAADVPAMISQSCVECHDKEVQKGGLDLTALSFDLKDAATRQRWVRVYDRVQACEMPPKAEDLPATDRAALVTSLDAALYQADLADVQAHGRGPARRLNRDEYEQNLRDVLQLPDLDIRDILPEDREGHHFNKTTAMLDMSRVQLAAYLDAAEVALRAAMVTESAPPPVMKWRNVGTDLFPGTGTFGNREAMFFARDNKAMDWDRKKENEEIKKAAKDEGIEMALFRSASWPYIGNPKHIVAKHPGRYKVRFSARAVLQQKGFTLLPAKEPVPMTFRSRKPAGADIINEVRDEGGIIDIQPEQQVYETTVRLREGESFEYSLLGQPMPLAMNPNGSAPTYRYPPFPEGGQPGIAVQWLEVEGPLPPPDWPPASHRVLFDAYGIDVKPAAAEVEAEAKRLLRRFVNLAAREPVSEKELQMFDALIRQRMEKGASFKDAMLAGYKAFLASGDFIYLREPASKTDDFAIASRLSHFLANTRPDARLLELAEKGKLHDAAILREETLRLLEGAGFGRFVKSFTDYWLSLRHIRRDDPDIRLFPEYRFDEYLVESMGRETRTFFTAMIHENLPASSLVKTDFVFANDRLAKHYGLPAISGSAVRKVTLPAGSPFGGLLTQAAVLKVSSNGTSTSPVVRGAWVTERLIGRTIPPPPTSVPAVEPDIRGAKTIRDLLALHTKSQSCATCHAKFDPVGVALENFDILGGWRARYRGLEEGERVTGIDRAGHDFSYTLTSPVDASAKLANGPSFKDVNDLKGILAADSRQLARNVLQQLTIYATGTPVRYSDRQEIETLLDGCEADGYRVRDLLLALVQSRIFLGNN
ncbi:cytochrome c [Roseimicrobium gellanilyticum]|uniref:Cytochrome c n=1 Tax=Roseimicrobium gellanilyticum TaxID=748857 RepID=A0A366H2Q3_9BACT|nr:cytochrome c [Roseimicrobium gellanilyticum]